MIALNRKMPQTCLECPCMQTYVINKENIKNTQYLIRYCAATKQEMVSIELNTPKPVPNAWTFWPKPKWCPWKEIYRDIEDEESAWHMSIAGLGGSYE